MAEEVKVASFSSVNISPKGGFFAFVARATCFMFGVFSFILAIVLCLTIIGIIPGIMVFTTAAAMFAIAFGHSVECPHCQKRTGVTKGANDFRCKRCKNTVLVTWNKETP